MNSKHRILVIDDEEGVRDAFILALEDLDYIVDTAANGEEGIKNFKENKPELLFTDLKMPGISGVEVMRRVHVLDPNVRLYVITAFHEEYMEPLKQAAAEGLEFDLLCKPIGAEQICMVVNSVFNGPQACP